MPITPLFAVDITGVMALMIPIVALLIPVVAILVSHQQKMAQIFQGNTSSAEIENLRREIAELKSLVHNQAFALDDLKSKSLQAPSSPPLNVTLGGNS